MNNNRMYYSREAEIRAQRQQVVMVTAAATFSLAFGVLVALLLAPRRGEEMRQMLSETLGEAVSAGRDMADQVRRDVEGRVQNARH
jgi:ABC-type methionine transport system permease subunit